MEKYKIRYIIYLSGNQWAKKDEILTSLILIMKLT